MEPKKETINIARSLGAQIQRRLKQDLRYSPSDCFENFAFPDGLVQAINPALADIGERYHKHRKALMLLPWLGLTDIYIFSTPQT